MRLSGKTVTVGVTGGIAAYKSCELVSLLKKAGADVHVVLTEHALNRSEEHTSELQSQR